LNINTHSIEKKKNSGMILLCVLFALLMVFVISHKMRMHLDEMYSYCLANTPTKVHLLPNGNTAIDHITAPAAYTYFPAEQGLCAVTAVIPQHSFDYANVWHNQQMDTHPPLYYILLHTICSFFPGKFSVWYAGVINIIFALAIFLLLCRLLPLLTKDRFIQTSVLIAFVCSSAMLNATAFLRMYVVAMFFVTLQGYLLIKQSGQDISPAFCAELFAATYLGVLTHYHYAVFVLLISAVFAVQLLKAKKTKQLLLFAATQTAAGLCAFATFPAMYGHLFHRIRGMETLSNFASHTAVTYPTRLALYFGHINNRFFGGFFVLFVLFLLYAAICTKHIHTETDSAKKELQTCMWRYSLIFIPCTIFFLFVAKTVPYSDWVNDGRYIQMIFPLIFCGILTAVFLCVKQLIKPTLFKTAVIAVAAVITVGSFWFTGWDYAYLYRHDSENVELASQYSDSDCVWLQEENLLLCTLYELSRFRSVIWFNMSVFPEDLLKNCHPVNGKLVICITHFSSIDTDAALYRYLQYMPEHEQYSIVKRPTFFDRGMIYYLEKH